MSRADAQDAIRWREWCERHPISTYAALTGQRLNGRPHQQDKIDAAMDEVIASRCYALHDTDPRFTVTDAGRALIAGTD